MRMYEYVIWMLVFHFCHNEMAGILLLSVVVADFVKMLITGKWMFPS